ncbi:MAG: hypothetical protein ACYDAD_09035 [Acidimicrobiales bacterium]
MRVDLLRQARDALPPQLNAGILFGEGGCCVLGWLLTCAGFHPITLMGMRLTVLDPKLGGPAVDVVARVYGLPVEEVQGLARINDEAPPDRRREVVGARLDAILAAGSNTGASSGAGS